MAEFFEFGADFQVIINLAVEDDAPLAAIFEDGLVAGFQVDNFQPGGAKRKQFRRKNALLVRAAVLERISGLADSSFGRAPMFMREASNAAQCSPPFVNAMNLR
jgi:hypothetical protein